MSITTNEQYFSLDHYLSFYVLGNEHLLFKIFIFLWAEFSYKTGTFALKMMISPAK